MSAAPDANDAERSAVRVAFEAADRACAFGPSFFLGQLGRFVRDHCPEPEEHLPMVQIRLADGQTLDLCHIIGVSARWVMLAVRAARHQNDMAIEIVPFEMVRGVRIVPHHSEGAMAGFSQMRAPTIITAETLVERALSPRMTDPR